MPRPNVPPSLMAEGAAEFFLKTDGSAIDAAPDVPQELRLMDDHTLYNARIVLKVHGNPKRPGSQAAEDFAAYRPGMRVLDYLQCGNIPRRRARANIAWDIQRGYVRLEKSRQQA